MTKVDQQFDIKVLGLEEIEEIYMGPAVRHFPANERKPMKAIRRMYQAGAYEGLGLFEGESLVAYALYVVAPDGQNLLLDYYAVLEDHRGKGIGSIFLQRMSRWYADRQSILLETEDVLLAADDKEKQLRSRRNDFYLRNGVRETRIHVSYCGADYQVFYLPIQEQKDEIRVLDALEQIYRVMFPDTYKEWVKIQTKSE